MICKNIPKVIQEEFKIQNNNIKYPTYPDQDFQNSISDDLKFNNYTEENIKKTFNQFFTIFSNCKNSIYEIIGKNLHNIQEYCSNFNEKTMNYIFYFYITEKFIHLVENKYYKIELTHNLKKELFYDDMIFECSHLNENLTTLYTKEFKDQKDMNKTSQNFSRIIKRYNKLLKSENEIGNIIIRTIKFLEKYLFVPLNEELNKFKNIEKFQEDKYFQSKINEENEIILLNIILYLKKFEYLDFAFYNAAIY